ncbi:MAG: sigma 54-interacting transcriptional regulator [Clostridia bacterium]|nr:sigma 54-interacting transcriptional regulator [Clostridia bacterium]
MNLKPQECKIVAGIFETLSCLVVIDAEGRIVHLNNKYASILGMDPEEARGRLVDNVIPHTRMSTILTTGKEEIGSVFRMKNGETVVCNRYPIRENGEIIGAFAHTTFTRSNDVKAFVERIRELNNELDQCKDNLEKLQGAKYSLQNIIGKTPAIQQVISMVEKAAQTKSTVLITGATGTGKELVAHAIHHESQRRYKPLVRLNCASIPKDLFESELFGYSSRGAACRRPLQLRHRFIRKRQMAPTYRRDGS